MGKQFIIATHGTRAMCRHLRRFMRGRGHGVRGVAAIEFAAIAMMLVIMTLATVSLGMGFHNRLQVENAAHAGARYAMVNGLDLEGIARAAREATRSSDIVVSVLEEFFGCPSAAGVTRVYQNAICPDGMEAGKYVTVSTQGSYTPIFYFPIIASSFTFDGHSTVRIP
jgi:Flp pilus assembly protein TadG